ncbi:MAG: hypothetical protein DCC65_12200 [Planctomycetota bacterium]|nr:MAG: hypothetical protein DCC65_12200 [Planctomycetota bacterium]
MIIVIQPELMERGVFEAARRDPDLHSEYQLRFARCYDAPSPNARDEAFRRLHQEWFEGLGLRARIADCAGAFEHIRATVSRIVVAQTLPKGQAAELYGAPGNFTIALALSLTRLLEEHAFRYWAMHEFLHIDDMLDPAFAYDRTAAKAQFSNTFHDLARDRFAVLWAISVDARLEHGTGLRAGIKLPADARPRRRSELFRVFPGTGDRDADGLFDRVWELLARQRPTYADFLAWGRHGVPKLLDQLADEEFDPRPQPGARCPSCGFPTYDWAESTALSALPGSHGEGNAPLRRICGRCAEIRIAEASAAGRRHASSGAIA